MTPKEQLIKFLKEKKENIIIKEEKTKIKKTKLTKEMIDQFLIQMLIDFGYVEDDE